ncbi:MAG: hypothetical protein KDD83_26125 [Caldilineaceae bacterium]|nr:hypothetical protein [Caldilineaceae bacterium]
MRLTAGQAALAIIVWIALAALAVLAGWYLLAAILSMAGWLIESPWRPYGWSQEILVPLSRFVTLILGAAWLFLVMFMEYDLRRASSEGRFWRRSGWYLLFLVAAIAVALGVTVALA